MTTMLHNDSHLFTAIAAAVPLTIPDEIMSWGGKILMAIVLAATAELTRQFVQRIFKK